MGNKIKTFTDLNAWKEGHKLVVDIYKISDKFPKKEMYTLTSQLRRAAISVTSNLAEGFSRRGKKEKIQFYSIALGSVTETQNQLIVARDVGYISKRVLEELFKQSVIVHKLINGLIKGVKTRNP